MFTEFALIHPEVANPRALCAADAIGLGDVSPAVAEAIATGDWTRVAALADVDPDEREAA